MLNASWFYTQRCNRVSSAFSYTLFINDQHLGFLLCLGITFWIPTDFSFFHLISLLKRRTKCKGKIWSWVFLTWNVLSTLPGINYVSHIHLLGAVRSRNSGNQEACLSESHLNVSRLVGWCRILLIGHIHWQGCSRMDQSSSSLSTWRSGPCWWLQPHLSCPRLGPCLLPVSRKA